MRKKKKVKTQHSLMQNPCAEIEMPNSKVQSPRKMPHLQPVYDS
jgi:hypothetical protein